MRTKRGLEGAETHQISQQLHVSLQLCLNEICKCVSSEVNLPLTAPAQHTSPNLHLNFKKSEEVYFKFDHFKAFRKRKITSVCIIQVGDIVHL